MGGMPEDPLSEPDFLDLVLPYVRSDDEMFRRYRLTEVPALGCPITAIVGDADDHADERPWSRLTAKRFDQKCLPGGHFYLNEHPPVEIVSAVCSLGG
jgi:surfactin synthase thioesterase subunit